VPQGRVPHRRGRDPARAGRRLRRALGDLALSFDERAFAGPEHLDPAYVAGYERKSGLDPDGELAFLQAHGLACDTTLVDLGAGTGILAAAAAPHCRRVVAVDPSPAMVAVLRARGLETVEAGFLTYVHEGDAPQLVHTRNALHHLPDFWKGVALARIHHLLAPGGRLLLRDIVYPFEPRDALDEVRAWTAGGTASADVGWTPEELDEHVRTEHSTYSWLLEPLLRRAGFGVEDVSHRGVYATYVCSR
jgi:SAM-dependent methyltransferase